MTVRLAVIRSEKDLTLVCDQQALNQLREFGQDA